jgi:hypothetical protein
MAAALPSHTLPWSPPPKGLLLPSLLGRARAAGGSLVSYNSFAEQVDVETKLVLASKALNIWLGIRLGGRQQWYLLDGSMVGNGQPSNAEPYAHW